MPGQALLASGEHGELDKGRFAQLDKLLNQTDMYTKFLSEQMNSIEQATVEEAKAGSKRKAAAKGGKAKKAKTDGDAESPGCATKVGARDGCLGSSAAAHCTSWPTAACGPNASCDGCDRSCCR